MGSRVSHHALLCGSLVPAMFDEEEGGVFLQDDWEDEEDAERIRDAVAAAASLGLLDDEGNSVQLPLAASSSTDVVPDVCSTPPRRNIPQLSDVSMEKRIAPIIEDGAAGRKRLRFKQATTLLPVPKVQQGLLIDGVPVKSHPLYVRYFKMDANFRRLASKRMSQQKYRLVQQLVNQKSVEIYGETLTYDGDQSDFSAQVEYKFFLGIAKDKDKNIADRGYALSQLAVYERDNDLMGSDTEKCRVVKNVPSALFTYIGECGLVDINTVTVPIRGRPSSSSDIGAEERFRILRSMHVDEVAALLKDHKQVAAFHEDLRTQAINISNKVHSPHWAVTVELCGKTLAESDVLRIHGHLWVMLKGQSVECTDIAIDDGRCVPYFNWSALKFLSGMSARSAASAMAGAFYCTVNKKGTIMQTATVRPWFDFAVRDAWITSMYAADKIVYKEARAAYVRTVHRAAQNVQQLEFCNRERQKTLLHEKRCRIEAELREQFFPWKVLPEVSRWEQQYEQKMGRYLFLVLDGDSFCGKTKYALSLQPLGMTFYCDCTAGIPDLRDFDGDRFTSILFDELTAKEAIKLKKCLQASNEPSMLGVSPTMMSAYEVHTWRTRIIVSTNLWKSGVRKLKKLDRDWIEKNSIYISVQEPLWVQPV